MQLKRGGLEVSTARSELMVKAALCVERGREREGGAVGRAAAASGNRELPKTQQPAVQQQQQRQRCSAPWQAAAGAAIDAVAVTCAGGPVPAREEGDGIGDAAAEGG